MAVIYSRTNVVSEPRAVATGSRGSLSRAAHHVLGLLHSDTLVQRLSLIMFNVSYRVC